jgi:DNA-binding MarR family transcriptional regulator
VNISSGPRANTYPTPEYREILENIRNLKLEVAVFGQTNPGIQHNKLLKRCDALEESVRRHYNQLNRLEQALITAAGTRLTEKQCTILHWLTHHYREKAVYTVLIQRLSEELGIPESTVRWNLKGLRDADLINAGTKENKGVPVSLTEMGRIMASYSLASD